MRKKKVRRFQAFFKRVLKIEKNTHDERVKLPSARRFQSAGASLPHDDDDNYNYYNTNKSDRRCRERERRERQFDRTKREEQTRDAFDLHQQHHRENHTCEIFNELCA